jgi:hypothetical protein
VQALDRATAYPRQQKGLQTRIVTLGHTRTTSPPITTTTLNRGRTVAAGLAIRNMSPQRLQTEPVHLQLESIWVIPVHWQRAWEPQGGTSSQLHEAQESAGDSRAAVGSNGFDTFTPILLEPAVYASFCACTTWVAYKCTPPLAPPRPEKQCTGAQCQRGCQHTKPSNEYRR